MTHSEVIVIGGGIAGASAAYHLAERGRSVTLLERDEIASEASGVNAGGIGALGWGHVPDLEAHLTMGSLQIFRHLQLALGYDIEFRASGGLQAVPPGAQYEYARDRVLALKSRGYTAELLDINAARSIEPELNPELAGALHFPLRGQADPQKATRAIAAAAESGGAEILTGQEVKGITRTTDGDYLVICPDEEYRADTIILAGGSVGAGHWARCSASTYPSFRCVGRCGRRSRCRPGCFTECRRWNPTPIGAPTPAATPIRRLS